MADTNTTDVKSQAAASKYESNRAQQTLQKAEAEKASDYDTGDHIALRQDILNPNLHYGLANEEETLLPTHQSGEAGENTANVGSDSLSTQPSSLSSAPTGGDYASPSSPSGLSAPEDIVSAGQESPILSINNASEGVALSAPLAGGNSSAVGPGIQSSPINTGSPSAGSLPPANGGSTAKGNAPVKAEDISETTSENGTLRGSVTATDLDGDAITYSLDGQPAEGTVTLQDDGSYSFEPGPAFDDLAVGESREVSFTFSADDGKGSTDQGTVTIVVTGTNDAPTAVDLSSAQVDENASGAVIGTLSTTDVDTSDTHSYTVSDDRFEVVEDGSGNMVLQLKDGESLDHESEPTVTLTVTTTDNHGGSVSEDFTIDVGDLNEAVTAKDATETTSENVALRGSVTATDLDVDAITYSLDGQPAEGTVTLQDDGSYSFEPGTAFDDLAVGESREVSFTFSADDGKGSTDQGTVTIVVTGTNDAPTAVDLSSASVDENASGAVIGTLSTTDVDTSDTHSYTVSDDRFEVVEDGSGNMVLQLKDGESLDHESEPTVTLTVTSDDGHGGSVSEDFTIDVGDLNEQITAYDSTMAISEDVISVDSAMFAEDPDGDPGIFTILTQPSSGTVTTTGEVSEFGAYTLGKFNFVPGDDFNDLAEGETRTVSFDYQVEDGNGSVDTGTVSIQVTGTNDAPTAVILSDSLVDENDAGAVIGTLTTTDVDTSDTHSYTVSDDRFEVAEQDGAFVLKLKDGVSLDHETEPSVTLTVTTTDNHGGSVSEDFTIDVGDLNEAVTANDATETTSENVALRGSVTATDLDGDAITYSLDGQPAEGTVTLQGDGSYSFEPGTAFDDLAVGESREVSFTFSADDGKGSTDQGTVTIVVTGTNDAPTAVDLSSASVDENASGAVIGTLSTTDVDSSDTHSYSVDDARFEVAEQDGAFVLKLKDGVSLDHETEPTVTLTVTTTDNHGGSVSEDFTIDVGDLNEAVTANDATETTSENVALRGSVTATDLDGDAISYSLDGQPAEGSVTLHDDGSYSFEPGTAFDDLAVGESREVSFTFSADDGKGSTDQGTVTIVVTGTNDAPTAVDLSSAQVDENASGAVIGTLSTTDVDSNDTHSYSVDDARFEVAEQNGAFVLKLKDGVSLDHETEPTVTLTVTTTDNHGGSVSEDFTIDVGDIDDSVTAQNENGTTTEDDALNSVAHAHSLNGGDISYSLVDQPGEGSVVMHSDGSYTFDPGQDFQDLSLHESRTVTFEYSAKDSSGQSGTGTVTIEVRGTNDAPTAIEISNSSFDENASGAVIGTLSTTDVDTNDSHTYSVNDDRFEVVDDGSGAMVLKVKDGITFDHETEPSVDLVLTTTDQGGLSHSEPLTINVADVNEGPTLDATGSYNFLYNGSFEVFNGGVHGGGDGTGWYEDAYIDGWKQSNIDVHEAGHMGLGATDGAYHVDLAAQSNGTLTRELEGLADGDTYSLSMDLKSRGVNGDGSSGTAEQALGQSVVQVVWNGEIIATIDPANDGLGWNTYTLDLTAGTGDGSNTITFIEMGSENNSGTLLDNFQINDSDGFGVLENETGAEIATLSVSDVDNRDGISYGVDDSRFEVVTQDDAIVLKLKDGISLDYEKESSVDVTVTATDSGNLSTSQTLTVVVGDIDDMSNLNQIYGSNQNDTLNGTHGDDMITASDGNDDISGYGGNDTIYGDAGQDTIDGGTGNDDIYGGADSDSISGGDGKDFINGEEGADILYGDAGSDALHGEAGNDQLYGGTGNDTAYGGTGDDILFGGEGTVSNNTTFTDIPNSGDDALYGGSGNDTLIGGDGNDYLSGGEGDDTFLYMMGDGNDTIDGGSAGDWTDSLEILAADGTDSTTYGTDWTISLDTGTATMVDGSDQMLLSDDATGTIDFSDGSQIELENIDNISW